MAVGDNNVRNPFETRVHRTIDSKSTVRTGGYIAYRQEWTWECRNPKCVKRTGEGNTHRCPSCGYPCRTTFKYV